MSKTEDEPKLLPLIREFIANKSTTRSPIYQWMWRNYEKLRAELDGERPDWNGMADLFAQAGLTDGKGQTPKGETLRHTWWRVRKRKAKSNMTIQPSLDLSQRQQSPKPEIRDATLDKPGKAQFVPARLPSVTTPISRDQSGSGQKVDPEEVRRQISEQTAAMSKKMPKPID